MPGLSKILSANVISSPYDAERFSLDWTRVKIGELVHVENTGRFYLIKDLTELNNESGYTPLGVATPSAWGSITGTLSDQTDLQAALSAKQNTITGQGDVPGLTVSSTPQFAGLALGASAAGAASFRIAHGSAPSSPVNGDIWTTTAGLFVRIAGVTIGPLS